MSRVGTRIIQKARLQTVWWLMVKEGKEACVSPGLGD